MVVCLTGEGVIINVMQEDLHCHGDHTRQLPKSVKWGRFQQLIIESDPHFKTTKGLFDSTQTV